MMRLPIGVLGQVLREQVEKDKLVAKKGKLYEYTK
jgi:hypothetical protein